MMKNFSKSYLSANPLIQLLPFLFIYLILIILFDKQALIADEKRYYGFAQNLLNGYYSPPPPNINLWNGPGYPIFIAIFVKFHFPVIAIKLLNGLLLYFSLVLSHKSINFYLSKNKSLIFSIILGFYYPIYRFLPKLLTECFSWFLISLLCFLILNYLKTKYFSLRGLIFTSFILAFLAMTKVIFGYVIVIMIIISTAMLIKPELKSLAKKVIILFITSFIFCLPYLFYTYSLTGKFFYWANSGGYQLFTMTSPYEDEFGDWLNEKTLSLNQERKILIDSLFKLPPMERDNAFFIEAKKNFSNYPIKYVKNWASNLGRLFFSFPHSYQVHDFKTFLLFLPNIFVVVFIIISFIIGIRFYNLIPDEIKISTLFFSIYLGGSSLISAYNRMFYITMPFWILFISYITIRFISIKKSS